MISIHNKNNILRIIFKPVCKLFDKIIHLMDLVHIVLPLVILGSSRRTGHSDLMLFKLRFLRVGSVSLHRDGINIIRLILCGIQAFQDLICKNPVSCPAQRVFIILLRHILCRGKSVKSQIRENTSSSVEIRLIVMYGMTGISQLSKSIRSAFTGCLLQNTLIRIFSRSEIPKAHACNGLKLCICRTCAYRRHFIISGGILLHQLAEVRYGIFGYLQIIYKLRIKERFQLQENNVGIFSLSGFRQVLLGFFNPFDFFFRVISRTADSGIKDRNPETVRISVILIGKGYVSKIIGQHSFFQRKLCHSGKKHKSGKYQRNIPAVFQLSFKLRSFDDQRQKRQCKKPQYDQCHNHSPFGKIFFQKSHSICQKMKIRSGKRCNTGSQDHTVYDSKKKPEHHQQHTDKASSSEQVYNQRRCEDQSRIVGKHQWPACHKIPCLSKGMSADRLNQKISCCTDQCMKQQRNPVTYIIPFHLNAPLSLLHL